MSTSSLGDVLSDPLDNKTKGVKTLLGDPKKAIIKLSIPMVIAMSVQTIYNFVDAVWVSGLGTDALSAVGFFFPFMFFLMAISNGIGIGGSSAVSRMIGANDKKGADNVADHSMIFSMVMAIAITIPAVMFAEPIFSALGAGEIAPLSASYARIMFGGSTILFFTNVSNALLRGEGDTKRAMYALMLGSVLNIILDPIFIYTFGLGVSGAAWATLISMATSSILLFYWLFVKNDAYVTIDIHNFKYDKAITKNILRVGLPATVQHMSMSLMMLLINGIVVTVGGTDGIAIFSTGWRVVTLATLPLVGIATALTAVAGAAYGQKAYDKLNVSHMYSVTTGIKVELILAALTFILAPQITSIFTHTGDTIRIAGQLTSFLRIICVFYPFVAFGMLSSSVFQGTGHGEKALVVTIFRSILMVVPLAYIFSIPLDMGLTGVWMGIVVGNIIGSFATFIWARIFIRKLETRL